MQRILESINAPATVSNMRCDYLAANHLGRALYAPLFDSRQQPPNSARFTFLDPVAQEFFIDWEKAGKDLVAALRQMAGRSPYDRALSDLGASPMRSSGSEARIGESGGAPGWLAISGPVRGGTDRSRARKGLRPSWRGGRRLLRSVCRVRRCR